MGAKKSPKDTKKGDITTKAKGKAGKKGKKVKGKKTTTKEKEDVKVDVPAEINVDELEDDEDVIDDTELKNINVKDQEIKSKTENGITGKNTI